LTHRLSPSAMAIVIEGLKDNDTCVLAPLSRLDADVIVRRHRDRNVRWMI
jgi:hypothetical protein